MMKAGKLGPIEPRRLMVKCPICEGKDQCDFCTRGYVDALKTMRAALMKITELEARIEELEGDNRKFAIGLDYHGD